MTLGVQLLKINCGRAKFACVCRRNLNCAVMAYELNLEEMMLLSQKIPSLLTLPDERNCTGRYVVCMHAHDFETRNARDLGILEYYGEKVKLKGTKKKTS